MIFQVFLMDKVNILKCYCQILDIQKAELAVKYSLTQGRKEIIPIITLLSCMVFI